MLNKKGMKNFIFYIIYNIIKYYVHNEQDKLL